MNVPQALSQVINVFGRGGSRKLYAALPKRQIIELFGFPILLVHDQFSPLF